MSEHKHGEMNTNVQEDTYNSFLKFGMWSGVAVIGVLIFLAIFAS